MKRFLSIIFYGAEKTAKSEKEAAGQRLSVDTLRYNYGISGHTKMGKSTLVNVLLGRDMSASAVATAHTATTAVATDHTEATHIVSKHDMTKILNGTLWDLPGCGTLRHGTENYYEDETLYAFDLLIIVTEETITPDEMKFASESLKRKQPVIFVRSKCDIALSNDKKFGKITEVNQEEANKFVAKMLIEYERRITESKLENVNLVKVFFISSLVMYQDMKGIVPKCRFQENEFLREINQAAACKRGK